MKLRTPPSAHAIISDMVTHGWNLQVIHGEDTGGNPYLHVEGYRQKGDPHMHITWHTRDNKAHAYRLFSALFGQKVITLATGHQLIKGELKW